MRTNTAKRGAGGTPSGPGPLPRTSTPAVLRWTSRPNTDQQNPLSLVPRLGLLEERRLVTHPRKEVFSHVLEPPPPPLQLSEMFTPSTWTHEPKPPKHFLLLRFTTSGNFNFPMGGNHFYSKA